MVTMLESCEHLELKPNEGDKNEIRRYIERVKKDAGLYHKLFEFLWGESPGLRAYIPYCRKNDCVCVVMESPIMSQQYYGDMYQQIGITLINTPRMRRCEDREFPETSDEGQELFPNEFLLRRIVGYLRPETEEVSA